jgi:2,4-dienoyl-CoA reductase-like NADH-dependent reductase (Old Yellow Enzyme family)
MATPRYDAGPVDPAPLGKPLHFHNSGRTAKNRFLKSPMAENLATWSPKNITERGVPTDETIQLYRR